MDPNEMKESVRVILEDFYRANAVSEAHIVTPNVPSQVLWSPRSNEVIKVILTVI